jgi:hypothetical protein
MKMANWAMNCSNNGFNVSKRSYAQEMLIPFAPVEVLIRCVVTTGPWFGRAVGRRTYWVKTNKNWTRNRTSMAIRVSQFCESTHVTRALPVQDSIISSPANGCSTWNLSGTKVHTRYPILHRFEAPKCQNDWTME